MSLLVWLPLISNTENQGLMELPEPSYDSLTVSSDGKLGGCYADARVYHASEEFLGNEWSVATWVKGTWAASGNSIIACKNVSSAGSDCQIYLSSYYGKPNVCANGYTNGGAVGTTDLEEDVWYHVVGTYDGSTAKIYLNGVLEGTKTVSTVQPTGSNNFAIGCRSNNAAGTSQTGKSTTRKFNDFRLYDHCLSEKEVKELSKGLVAHYPLNDFIANENLIANSNAIEFNGTYVSGSAHHWSNWTNATNRSIEYIDGKYWFHYKTPATTTYGGFNQDHANNTSQPSIKPNTNYTVSATWFASAECNCIFWFHMRSSEGGANLCQLSKQISVTTTPTRFSYTFNSGSDATYTINRFNLMMGSYHHTTEGIDVYFTDVKMEESSVATPWIPAKTDTLYSDMGLDETVIYDTSGYKNHGTLSPNSPIVDTSSPRYSSCMKFNGENTYINVGRGAMVNDEVTVSTWAYMEDWSDFDMRIISCVESGGWTIQGATNKRIDFAVGTGTESNTYKIVYSSNNYIDEMGSGWHLITGTYDGFDVKMYIDGEILNTLHAFDEKVPIFYNSKNSIFIGAEAGSSPTVPAATGYYFDGKISDVRVYATALSADDVRDLYRVSSSVDNHGNAYSYEINEI